MGNSLSSSTQTTAVFFIGYNEYGEFGLNHKKNLKRLKKCTNPRIIKVFPSYKYIIYADIDYKNIWSAGHNKYGQCGVGHFTERIKKLAKIKYFEENGIKIKKICVNFGASHTLFISDRNELFGCGENKDFGSRSRMGLNGKNLRLNEPVLILPNIIDAKPAHNFSVALSSNKAKTLLVISNWSRTHKLPKDIMNMVLLFAATKNIVYSTTSNTGIWLQVLHEKHIIKIAVGDRHSLFLEHTGVVWCCGQGYYGSLGLGNMESVDTSIPTQIKYFMNNNIKIKDIHCGCSHNLALDRNGKVYSWGSNQCGQCGDGTRENVYTPKPISYFTNTVIDIIGCGYNHSYVHTKCGKHFLFGSNKYSECISFDAKEELIKIPHRIDDIVMTKYDIKSIIEVVPGHENTSIICSL
eukprot:481500_1